MASLLQSLQDEMVAQLQAIGFFSSITILPEYLNDVSNAVDRAIAEVGSCVVIGTPQWTTNHPNMSGPFFDDIAVACRVLNVPTISGPPYGMEIAEQVAAGLHLWTPAMSSSQMVQRGRGELAFKTENGTTGWVINFTVSGGQNVALTQSAQPIFVYTPPVIAPPSPASLAMSTTTPGAAIYWSIDPSINPAPAGGTLYTAPFVPTSGLTYRARAWIYGQLPSSTATITIP